MRGLAVLLLLAACTPAPDPAGVPEATGVPEPTGAFPPLLPLEAVLGPEAPPRADAAEAARLAARAEALRARADALRAAP